MASRIQGITVEIGGDTTKLTTALKGVNSEIRNTQSQYDVLQREIIATEAALEDLEEQAEQSAVALQKIASAGDSLKSAGDKVTDAGKKMSVVSAGIVAAGTASTKMASIWIFGTVLMFF